MLKLLVVQLLSAIPIMPPWCFNKEAGPWCSEEKKAPNIKESARGSASTVQEPELDDYNF